MAVQIPFGGDALSVSHWGQLRRAQSELRMKARRIFMSRVAFKNIINHVRQPNEQSFNPVFKHSGEDSPQNESTAGDAWDVGRLTLGRRQVQHLRKVPYAGD